MINITIGHYHQKATIYIYHNKNIPFYIESKPVPGLSIARLSFKPTDFNFDNNTRFLPHKLIIKVGSIISFTFTANNFNSLPKKGDRSYITLKYDIDDIPSMVSSKDLILDPEFEWLNQEYSKIVATSNIKWETICEWYLRDNPDDPCPEGHSHCFQCPNLQCPERFNIHFINAERHEINKLLQ